MRVALERSDPVLLRNPTYKLTYTLTYTLHPKAYSRSTQRILADPKFVLKLQTATRKTAGVEGEFVMKAIVEAEIAFRLFAAVSLTYTKVIGFLASTILVSVYILGEKLAENLG